MFSHIDDICSLDILDLIDYGLDNLRGYRYVFVVLDNFSKVFWNVPRKNRNAQIIKDFFETNLIISKIKPNLIETDDGGDFVNKVFNNFLSKIKIKRYSRNMSLGAVFADWSCFSRTIGDLLRKPVFEKGDGKWIDDLPIITKQ